MQNHAPWCKSLPEKDLTAIGEKNFQMKKCKIIKLF